MTRRIGQRQVGLAKSERAEFYGALGSGRYPINPKKPVTPNNLNKRISMQRTQQFVEGFLPHRAASGPYQKKGDLYQNYPSTTGSKFTYSPAGWQYTVDRTFGIHPASGTQVKGFMDYTMAELKERTGATTTQLQSPMVTATMIHDDIIMVTEDPRHCARNAALWCLAKQNWGTAQQKEVKDKLYNVIMQMCDKAKNPQFDCSNLKHYPRTNTYSDDATNFWQISYIVLSYLLLYDDTDVKCDESDYNPFTDRDGATDITAAADRKIVKEFFDNWSEFLDILFRRKIVEAYPGYYNDTYSNVQATGGPRPIYWVHNPNPDPNNDDPTTPKLSVGYMRYLNNRRGFYNCFRLAYGLKFKTGAEMKPYLDDAYRWVYHALRFGCFENGDQGSDEERIGSAEPAEGLIYKGSNVVQLCWMVDMAMRHEGNIRFYNLAYVNGVTEGTAATQSATPKTLKTLINRLGTYAKVTLPHEHYASFAQADNQTDTGRVRLYKVGPASSSGSFKHAAVDTMCATIASAITRDPSMNEISIRKQSAGYNPWASNEQGGGNNALEMGFRGLNANIYLEWGLRGIMPAHPVTNPSDYPDFWATAYLV